MTAPAFVGDCVRTTYSGTTTKTLASGNAVPIAGTVPVGDTIFLLVNCPAAGTANTSCTVTDTQSNTWVFRGIVAQAGGPGSGELALMTCAVTHALGVGANDKLTITVNNTGTTVWGVLGLQFTGLGAYDSTAGVATNTGASSQNLNSGTTATASQASQLLVGGFAGTGAGQALNTLVPAGFTARPVVTTTGTVRNTWGVYGFVNVAGARTITAHMADNASHAWCGLIIAYDVTIAATGIYRIDSGGVLTNIGITPL